MSTPQISALSPAVRKAVVPAAGLGTRLRPLTTIAPKEMLPVGRRPVLAHIAAELRGAGITDVLFIVSDQKPQIRAYFGELYDGHEFADTATSHLPPLRCSYAIQDRQRGLGDALLYAEAWTQGSRFVVAFGDCIIEAPETAVPLKRLVSAHINNNAFATVLAELVPKDQVHRYGVLAPTVRDTFDGRTPFAVSDIVEKPSTERAPSGFVVAARWVLEPAIFEYLRMLEPDSSNEIGLTEAIRSAVTAGKPVWAAPLLHNERRRDIGNFETFFASFIHEAFHDAEYGESARRSASVELKALRQGS